MNQIILTINREYGSGGHSIGTKLAEKLGVACYDNELITQAAKKSGIPAKYFKSVEEVTPGNLLYSLSLPSSSHEIYGRPVSDRTFDALSNAITDTAKKGACVLIGSCADYVLRENKNCIHLFFTGSFQSRVSRAKEEYHIPVELAENHVKKTDKARRLYYQYHTNRKWGNPVNYDLIINTDKISANQAVDAILSFIKLIE